MSLGSPAGYRLINLLGGIVMASHLVLAVLSYPQAAALWSATEFPQAGAFFQSLGSQSPTITANPSTWLAVSRLFGSTEAVLLSQAIPLAIASIAAMFLVLNLTRRGELADAMTARLLLRWSMAFAAATIFAYPVFTQDFWLSVMWGRMVAAGGNPFHTLFTANDLADLPLDHFPMLMSYGPLWASMSAVIALVAWNNAIIMGLLFKVLIAAAWIFTLLLVDRFHRDASQYQRCLAIALFGWIPLGVSQSIAEGHNDIVMMASALLWFVLLIGRNAAAPAALAASVLCKYVTAPLFLIDLISAFGRERLTVLQYARRMLPAALMTALFLGLFFRSSQFFDGLRLVSEWYFLRPSEAVSGLEQLIGMPLRPMHLVALGIFPVVAVYAAALAVRDTTTENLAKATVALVAAILFGAISHLWPWYLVWGLTFAAVLPQWWVSRYIAGVALIIPFSLATWWIDSIEPLRNVLTLAIYTGAGAWAYLTRLRPAASALRAGK